MLSWACLNTRIFEILVDWGSAVCLVNYIALGYACRWWIVGKLGGVFLLNWVRLFLGVSMLENLFWIDTV